MGDQETTYTSYLAHLGGVTSKGDKLLNNIEETIRSKSEALSEDDHEILQITRRPLDRVYRGREVPKLVGVSQAAIYTAEKEGKLPPPRYKSDSAGVRKIRAGYSLDEINKMREVFGTLPHRKEGDQPVTVGFLNLKGGSWKTTLSLLFGQYLAVKGYRVLFVDSDPQGTLSFFMGCRPDADCKYEDTIAPFVLGDDECMRSKGVDEFSLRYAIRKTHWPNIDLIPAGLSLSSIDMHLPYVIGSAETKEEKEYYFKVLRDGIDTVKGDYDVVVLDGTPSLNILTMNVFSACDAAIVPCPAQMADFASTLQFFNSVNETIASFDENEYAVPVPGIRVLITKFASAGYAQWMESIIRQTFGDMTLESLIKKTDEVGKKGSRMITVYESNAKDSNNRKALKNACAMYDAAFSEILEEVIFPFWPSMADAAKRGSPFERVLKTEGII